MKNKFVNIYTTTLNLIFVIGFFVRRIMFNSWLAGFLKDDTSTMVEMGFINDLTFMFIAITLVLSLIFLNIISIFHSRKTISIIILHSIDAILLTALYVFVFKLSYVLELKTIEIATAVLVILLFIINIIQMVLIVISKSDVASRRLGREIGLMFLSIIVLGIYSYASIAYTIQVKKYKAEEQEHYELLEENEEMNTSYDLNY